jgi:signal transduction histidine kinase
MTKNPFRNLNIRNKLFLSHFLVLFIMVIIIFITIKINDRRGEIEIVLDKDNQSLLYTGTVATRSMKLYMNSPSASMVMGGSDSINSMRNKQHAYLTIKDTGVGIAPENLARLFQDKVSHSRFGTGNEKKIGLGRYFVKILWTSRTVSLKQKVFRVVELP